MKENRLVKVIKNPFRLLLPIIRKFPFFISDKLFVKIAYFATIGKILNITNPTTYNEKIQWLKLNDRKPIYTMLVDKFSAKKLVAKIIGEEYIIPTLGVWDRFEDIDFDTLPNRFVLKCTHDSGTVILCKDKNFFDKKKAKERIVKAQKSNFYWTWREWPYKDIKPRIIAEEYLVDECGNELKDFKFFCFNGMPRAMYIASERQVKTKFDFYDLEFNHLPFVNGYENSKSKITKPLGFDQMIELSKIISKDFIHVRVDFYDINGKVYFGELTFYHWSGMVPFKPEKWDRIFGDWLDLTILEKA